ncbi:hypothetical protein [uncultured Traorella sp.]|uniref:hypothetical protein n=1 Tax=uncultured Traorella sp. TaxID=1929048 RepID=UPI0025E96698|nr:hypothetical protein [uncultured Traorella sp.]
MQENKGNIVSGIFGALIGGLIAAIPWIAAYVFLNLLSSLAAILIAMGAYAGYKKLNGTVNKGTVWIIGIITLVIVTVANFVIIPLIYLARDGFALNLTYYKWFFSSDELMTGMIKDYVISIIFAFIGVQSIMRNIRSDRGIEDPASYQNVNEGISDIKSVFSKYHAFDKGNAISKEMVLSETGNTQLFRTLCAQRIIRRYRGNYYYDERAETDTFYRTRKVVAYVLSITAIVLVITISLAILIVVLTE